jgi:uncharacterized protein (DUF1330 family)
MEENSFISIAATRMLPEYRERYYQWVYEVYYPLLLKTPWINEIDSYRILTENSEYNSSMSIYRFKNLRELENLYKSPEYISLAKDRETTFYQTGRGERFWQATYQLLKTFTNSSASSPPEKNDKNKNIPVVHLEGYRLSPDQEENYYNWFIKRGYEAYVPLLMKLPGLQEYSWYKLIEVELPHVMMPKDPNAHPPYLSILHFDSLRAYENFENSPELAVFREGIKVPFSRGLLFKWYVQYQLTRSWRK